MAAGVVDVGSTEMVRRRSVPPPLSAL